MQNHITSTTHRNPAPFPAPHSPAPAPDSATAPAPEAAEPTVEGRKRGRPSVYSEKVIQMICATIRQLGSSDSAAAESVGMSSSSISRWKHDHPELKPRLKQAREDCRRRHLERIEKFAERDDAIGFRASIWLAERVFPETFAKTQRERWACETAQEQRDVREERELGNVLWAERCADMAAEKKAAEAEAAKQAAASASDAQNVKNPGEEEAGLRGRTAYPPSGADSPDVKNTASTGGAEPAQAAEEARYYSEADSHNVKNPGSPGPAEPTPETGDSTFFSEDDSHNVINSGRPDAGPLMEALFGPCVSDSRNVKYSPPSPAPAVHSTNERTVF